VTLTSRLALDHLKSARVQRETYPGPWLPEPVPDDELGPLKTIELRDTVSFGTLHVMERLPPQQRAVYVLREAFQLPYDQIANVIGGSAPTCQQMHKRARERLAADARPYVPNSEEHHRLARTFLDAADSGELASLSQVLADDVAVWNDGGGRVRAARRPIRGRTAVLAFLQGLHHRYRLEGSEIVDANGYAGVWMRLGGAAQYLAFDTRDGRIRQGFAVLNPDKLTGMVNSRKQRS
jgi:RNA polymerase sigma-70 factor, ECF subfamily